MSSRYHLQREGGVGWGAGWGWGVEGWGRRSLPASLQSTGPCALGLHVCFHQRERRHALRPPAAPPPPQDERVWHLICFSSHSMAKVWKSSARLAAAW